MVTQYIGKDDDFQSILGRFGDGVPATIDCGYGWASLIHECESVLSLLDPDYRVMQIKEKMGGLRFYFNPSDMNNYAKFSSLIMQIEEKSYYICEECGSDGYKRNSSYGRIYVACDVHASND